jgi:hypothetical protein
VPASELPGPSRVNANGLAHVSNTAGASAFPARIEAAAALHGTAEKQRGNGAEQLACQRPESMPNAKLHVPAEDAPDARNFGMFDAARSPWDNQIPGHPNPNGRFDGGHEDPDRKLMASPSPQFQADGQCEPSLRDDVSRELDPWAYLYLNADLRKAFGTDVNAARGHWLRHGRSEGRMGGVSAPFRHRSIDFGRMMSKPFGLTHQSVI